MWWRVPSTGRYWSEHKGDGNREALRSLVESGQAKGLLAFDESGPLGWCSLGPRTDFPYLSRARLIGPPPGPDSWAVTCFFIRRGARRSGVARALLASAIDYAREEGAAWLLGFASDAEGKPAPDAFVHTGTSALFRSTGFVLQAFAGKRSQYALQL